MKYRLMLVILIVLIICSGNVLAEDYNPEAYDHKIVENYIAYRIKYIHSVAYNTSLELKKSRVENYAQSIIKWSDYYSRELGVEMDPLLVTAILETETNFVSRADYDNGASIGVSSMKVKTAKWIANRLGVNYTKWRVLDATDLGIRFAVYYLGLAQQEYGNDLHTVITSYNQGLNGAKIEEGNQFYNNYLFKVLGRYQYYQKRISKYGGTASDYFLYKFNKQYK
ncbi:transglycosylase SLT domain-containing protein [Halanaerobaculum tunisiense]